MFSLFIINIAFFSSIIQNIWIIFLLQNYAYTNTKVIYTSNKRGITSIYVVIVFVFLIFFNEHTLIFFATKYIWLF